MRSFAEEAREIPFSRGDFFLVAPDSVIDLPGVPKLVAMASFEIGVSSIACVETLNLDLCEPRVEEAERATFALAQIAVAGLCLACVLSNKRRYNCRPLLKIGRCATRACVDEIDEWPRFSPTIAAH